MRELAARWNLGRAFISSFVVFVLFCQAVVTAIKLQWPGWPFTDYPMYRSARYEGDVLDVEPRLIARFADGSEGQLTEQMLGVQGFWHIWNTIIQPIRSTVSTPEQKAAQLSWVVDRLREVDGRDLVELRLEDDYRAMTRDGLQTLPQRHVFARVSFPNGIGSE